MPRWKALSAELDPRVRELVTHLRRLKDHSGLSLRQLAAKTGYSEKSWERYLGGTSLPPREAVDTLARIGGADPVRLLALREVAADTWNGRRAHTSAPDDLMAEPAVRIPPNDPVAETVAQVPPNSTATEPVAQVPPEILPEPAALSAQDDGRRTDGRSLRVALVAGAVALVMALSSAVLLVLRLNDDAGGAPETVAAAPSTAPASSPPPSYTCRIERIDGLWTAGISRTRDTELSYGDVGPGVAEAQCLLRRAGISPGGIDGMFGPLTQRAVKAMQKRSGLVVDGMIGPRTWKALRG
ncbi:peptidoglycan-binding protein [Streptomyces sp. NPDC002306]